MNPTELEEFDILPLGRNETRPVHLSTDGNPYVYPETQRLLDNLDAPRLFQEFENYLRQIPATLFAGRDHLFWQGRSREQVFKDLAKMGFAKGVYSAVAMRRPGSTELRPEIGAYTREVLASLGAVTFRQQYVLAEPHWRCTEHVDHYSLRVHGLRVHIPLTCSSFMAYPGLEGENIYEMKPGEAWFINSGRPHYAYNSSDRVRINIQTQIESDAPLFAR
jgi:hypothetical protein